MLILYSSLTFLFVMILFSKEPPKNKEIQGWSREELEARYEYLKELNRKMAKLIQKIRDQQQDDKQQDLALMEQIQWMKREIFGSKSERMPRVGEKGDSDPTDRLLSKLGKVLLPSKRYPKLEVREKRIDFEDPPICDECEKPMKDMGQTEDAERIEVIPKYFYIERLQRAKYCCPRCFDRIETAPLPPRIFPGSSFGDSFILDLAVSKYADHLPVERYAGIARRMGLKDLQASSLYNLLHRFANLSEKTIAKIKSAVLEEKVPNVDETWIRMMERSPKKTWWIWSFLNKENAYYEAHDSRAAEKARAFFQDSKAEYAVSDAYSGYPRALKGLPIENAFCWAHARRKFREAAENHPEAGPVLEKINELFHIERQIKNKDPAQRRRIRKKKSKPILERLRSYLMELHVPKVLSIGKARNYVLRHWTELTRFLEDGRIPLDNNAAERSLRGVVLGRKNYLGMHSPRGAKTTAAIYTLTESYKRNQIDPYRYLWEMMRATLSGRSFPIAAAYAERR